jgi:TIR domain-containing protein
MSAPPGAASADGRPLERSYDVALSFAAQDHELAMEIERRLTRRRTRTYLYLEAPEETLGEDLRAALADVYSQATLVVFLVSRHYGSPATEIELEAARSGAAAEQGLVVVRIDETPLPPALQGRTWFDAARGTDALIHAIQRKLRRASLTLPAVSGLALLSAAALGAYLIAGLGFREPTRLPDALLLASAALPALWLVFFRLGPEIVRRIRARGLKGRALLQSPMIRRIDHLSTYAAGFVAVALATSAALGGWKQRRVQEEHDHLAQSVQSVGTDYVELRRALNELSTLAARCATRVLPEDLGTAVQDESAFEACRTRFAERAKAMQTAIQNVPVFGGLAHADDYLRELQGIENAAEKYLLHQIRELATPKPSTLSDELYRQRRLDRCTTLTNYNTLFASMMTSCEEAFRALEAEARERVNAHRTQWGRVL